MIAKPGDVTPQPPRRTGSWCASPEDEEYAHYFYNQRSHKRALLVESVCGRTFTERARVEPSQVVRQCRVCLERKD